MIVSLRHSNPIGNSHSEWSVMKQLKTKLASNLSRVREDIASACSRSGRDPGEVSLVAVTKSVGLDVILALMELGQLDDDTADSWRTEFGMMESGLDRIVKSSYELLGLVSFFTIASSEVRAWPLQSGTEALKAAGKIHSDMERGFIRAEVISYDDLVKCGSLAEARQKGLLRMEGKSYLVQDGDVITFLFNV